MNKEQTAKLIEVMQAYVDGKEIESQATHVCNPEWATDKDPSWNCAFYLYRVKKEPRVFHCVQYLDSSILVQPNERHARACSGGIDGGKYIKLIECL